MDEDRIANLERRVRNLEDVLTDIISTLKQIETEQYLQSKAINALEGRDAQQQRRTEH